jgi:excisionase family DNA binding protein
MFSKLSDAAKQLSVSERFLRQLVAEKGIPFYRLSPRTLRVDLDELRQHMRDLAQERAQSAQKEGVDDGD